MKKLLSSKYKSFVICLELSMLILSIPLFYNYVPINEGNKTFYIPSSDLDDVVKTLKTNGYEVTWIDKMMIKLRKIPDEGWYSLELRKEGRFSFFKHLYKYKTRELMDIVIYAGETKHEVTARIANDMKLDQKTLLNIYEKLAQFQEADILAQRYTIARKADENTTMHYIFLESRRTLNQFINNHFPYTPEHFELQIIHIIASIIQKESNAIEEMPLISSVIYNRLERGMKLQMDGTLNYGPYAHTIVTPERIKNDTSEYNTYKHKGLPPHPLSTVTLDALNATMNPAPNEYLFFMLNKNGTHNFTETYEAHLENIRAFRAYQEDKLNRAIDNNTSDSIDVEFHS